jgi:thiamine kinase-like enzyme
VVGVGGWEGGGGECNWTRAGPYSHMSVGIAITHPRASACGAKGQARKARDVNRVALMVPVEMALEDAGRGMLRPRAKSQHLHFHVRHVVRHHLRRKTAGDERPATEVDPTDSIPNVERTLDNTLPLGKFKPAILNLLQELHVPGWKNIPSSSVPTVSVTQIPGALTNTIYRLTPPASISAPHLLLRLYGPQAHDLIDRPAELAMLKRLSRHHIGPLLLGTFSNGRFEQWLDSHTISREEMCDANLSCSIARRMRELHDGVKLEKREREGEPSLFSSLAMWVPRAREIIHRWRKVAREEQRELVLVKYWEEFELAVQKYKMNLMANYPPTRLCQSLAFCHNDVLSTLH